MPGRSRQIQELVPLNAPVTVFCAAVWRFDKLLFTSGELIKVFSPFYILKVYSHPNFSHFTAAHGPFFAQSFGKSISSSS
jgi:hypothetical protein